MARSYTISDTVKVDAPVSRLTETIAKQDCRRLFNRTVNEKCKSSVRLRDNSLVAYHDVTFSSVNFNCRTRQDSFPTLSSNGLTWSPPAQESDGTLKKMKFSKAKEYCESIGERLPTLKEFFKLPLEGANLALFEAIYKSTDTDGFFWALREQANEPPAIYNPLHDKIGGEYVGGSNHLDALNPVWCVKGKTTRTGI